MSLNRRSMLHMTLVGVVSTPALLPLQARATQAQVSSLQQLVLEIVRDLESCFALLARFRPAHIKMMFVAQHGSTVLMDAAGHTSGF